MDARECSWLYPRRGLRCTRLSHCTCAVAYDVPASRTLHALWFTAHSPLPLYMHCGWWRICFWQLCGWLRHVALTTDVLGEIRLNAVSSRLANAKPLSLSVVVCVDDVRDWMVCGSGFSPGFRTVCQSSAFPRTLKVLGAARSLSLCLTTSNSPDLPGLKYIFPPTPVSLASSPISPL